MGLMGTAIAVSMSLGAMTLALILQRTGSFALFLSISGSAVVAGAGLLLLLRREWKRVETIPMRPQPIVS